MDFPGLVPSLFLFEWERLSFCLDLCEPLEEVLVPEVSRIASRSATFLGESSSDVELSVELSLVLIGLYLGLGGEGEGKIAVDGRMALIPVLVGELGGGGEEAKAWIAWSMCGWLVFGGGGIWLGMGLAGRVVVKALGVALLQSSLPSGKFNL